jgi:hypothetical protein
MPTEKNKWIEAVGKLITLTQERKLNWRMSSSTFPTYEADNHGKILHLYSTWDEGELTTHLQLKDPQTGVEWEFPYSAANEHLIEAVRYQLAGVGDFLDQLLAEAV